MTDSYISSGDKITITAAAAVTEGTFYVPIATEPRGVYLETGVTGDSVAVALSGVFTVAKEDGATLDFAIGERVYVKSLEATPTVTGNPVGFAHSAAVTGATTVQVRLHPHKG